MTQIAARKWMTAQPAAAEKELHLNFDLYDGLRFWSAFTHGFGAVAGGVGGLVLLGLAAARGTSALGIVSILIYTASMVALYLASCLYHCVHGSAHKRLMLRNLDHSMIYVLIAGTYTPVCLVALGGALGWTMFCVIWGLAALGVAVTLCWLNAPRTLTTLFYVGMGWIAVLALKDLLAVLSPAAFAWMLAGGVSYTVGGVLYALKWPLRDHARFGCHEIFHLFVLLGSACFLVMMGVLFLGA